MRSIKWCHLQWPWTNPNPVFQVTPLFDAKYLTNGYRYAAIVTIESEYETVPKLSNGTNFNRCHRQTDRFAACRLSISRVSMLTRDKNVHLVMWLLSSSKSAFLCTNFHHSRMIFRWDTAIWQFSRWRISSILNFRGPIIDSLKTPYRTSYNFSTETIALNCLVFEKVAFLYAFWRRRTNR